jgi:dipeptidyl aminopeptidase/acylaminoacyl peptidase
LLWVVGLWSGSVPIVGVTLVGAYLYCRLRYLERIVRIFEERPLFVIPRGTPAEDAEDVRLATPDGRTLRGCYLRTPRAARRGVILFGLEFGSDRWSAVSYCEKLLAAGYDVFACEGRNQGASDRDPSYDPLQWATDRDLADLRTAADYLHARPDADPAGIGVFGISKGGSLGLLLAAEDRKVRCVATDGAFATYTTMVPYMQKWVGLYVRGTPAWVRRVCPDWFYGLLGLAAIRKVEKRRRVQFVSVERAVRKLRQPLLMIHGGGDTYIKPEMATALFAEARRSRAKDLWVVPGAKHNQALHAAGAEYHRRLVEFFDRHLGSIHPVPAAAPALPLPTPAAAELEPTAGK